MKTQSMNSDLIDILIEECGSIDAAIEYAEQKAALGGTDYAVAASRMKNWIMAEAIRNNK